MTAEDLFDALELPTSTHVSQRITKKLLLEKGARTTADRRRINQDVERIEWRAVIKPTTVGISAHHEPTRNVPEISVINVELRDTAYVDHIAELIHRSIPYLTVLILNSNEDVYLSLADKRTSQSDKGRSVIDGDIATAKIGAAEHTVVRDEFENQLSIARQPQTDLYSVYQGWIQKIEALRASEWTGQFSLAKSPEQAVHRRKALAELDTVEAQIAVLESAAAKHTQMSDRVKANVQLQRLRSQRAAAQELL